MAIHGLSFRWVFSSQQRHSIWPWCAACRVSDVARHALGGTGWSRHVCGSGRPLLRPAAGIGGEWGCNVTHRSACYHKPCLGARPVCKSALFQVLKRLQEGNLASPHFGYPAATELVCKLGREVCQCLLAYLF